MTISEISTVATAIREAWAQEGEVPFPLYDREAMALAAAAIKAVEKLNRRTAR